MTLARPKLGERWLDRHGQTLFNIWLFTVMFAWVVWETHKSWVAGRLNYVEGSFAAQNLVMVALVLVRSRHRAVDHNPWHQAIAMTAFFSGMAFLGQASSGGPLAVSFSQGLTFASNVLGLATLVNLGRSFGILIALRKVKTGGLYSVVRHPMYATDILLRIGFVVSHVTWLTVVLFVVSSGCYVLRARLEERFLGQDPEYQQYVRRVRWRFIPFVY
jgi:protein-S-isoprenylcysteine O-methyltransferase Ste14